MTINGTWAYNKNDTQYKSAKELIQDLVNVASKGGNFLLDVGPTPEGTIQPEFVERLQEMGKWMKVYGDSIYGTTYGPLQNLAFGKTTAKGRLVYLHVFDWPSRRAGWKCRVSRDASRRSPCWVKTKAEMAAGRRKADHPGARHRSGPERQRSANRDALKLTSLFPPSVRRRWLV